MIGCIKLATIVSDMSSEWQIIMKSDQKCVEDTKRQSTETDLDIMCVFVHDIFRADDNFSLSFWNFISNMFFFAGRVLEDQTSVLVSLHERWGLVLILFTSASRQLLASFLLFSFLHVILQPPFSFVDLFFPSFFSLQLLLLSHELWWSTRSFCIGLTFSMMYSLLKGLARASWA